MDARLISFELVIGRDEQIDNLYNLLKKRNFTISHKNLPSYNFHKQFVLENPYRYWYLITYEKKYIGSFYLKKDNSVGINITFQNKKILSSILSFLKKNHSPSKSSASIIPPYFYINVPSDNIQLQNFLENLGASSIQISYKI